MITVLLLAKGPDLSAQTPRSSEYQIKAVFLLNFAQFVDWPPAAFAAPETPLVIGVLGEDPFGAQLDEAVRDEKMRGRPLVVRRYGRVEEIGECHVLFIGRSEASRLGNIVAGLRGRPILTVSDLDQFAQYGGMIRFVMEHNKVRLRINVDAAKASHLLISSKLLRPVEIVTAGKG